MPVFLIVLIVINSLYCVVGAILHCTIWREMSYYNSTRITLYGIIWTYDEWAAFLRILLIIVLFPFTFVFESMFFIGCWVSTLIRFYGRTDYKDFLTDWLLEDHYQYTTSVCVYIMKLCLRFNPQLKFKSNSRIKALFDTYFDSISEYKREKIVRYYGLPEERND